MCNAEGAHIFCKILYNQNILLHWSVSKTHHTHGLKNYEFVCKVPKSRATVDYTFTGVEPHRST